MACAAAGAGCGIGPGPSTAGQATLTITRDYGNKQLKEATESDPNQSETVIRFLDRESDLSTRYGGGFVQSIDGLSGTFSGGRSFDWFFYVNGIESPVGAAEVDVKGGDRIWWDYHDWTNAMRVPAVVGSFPEPFLQRSTEAGKRAPVQIECEAQKPTCETVHDRLADEGVDSSTVKTGERAGGGDAIRLLVGPWERIGESKPASLVANGPATSGVFAEFDRGGSSLQALGVDGAAQESFGDGTGLVAALHDGDEEPVWLITGTDEHGVELAAQHLSADQLHDRYALVVTDSKAVGVPEVDEAAEQDGT